MIRNVISIIDGATGSCGKGKVVGEIVTDISIIIGAAVTNCMPNAGHTYIDEKGNIFVFNIIPISCVNQKTELFIGPGSGIEMNSFIEEYEKLKPLIGDRKIYVHELVPLIEDRHKKYELKHIKSGSTNKGCGAVLQEKIMRDKNLRFFKGYKNAAVCPNEEYLDRLYGHLDNQSEYVILEVPQGCGLGQNYSNHYPYVTSRDISTTQFLDYSGISAERLLGTLMIIRPFPIRISNVTKTGNVVYTGNFGTGSPLTWTQINLSAKAGAYPYIDDVESYDYNLDTNKIKELINNSTDISLKQVFSNNFKKISLKNVTLIQALELERLIYKNKGINEYESNILCLYDNPLIRDLSEQTTVTKMERRIGDLDIKELKGYCLNNSPYGLYLNFFQHLNLEYEKQKGNFNDFYFNHYIRNYMDWLESETNTEILALGTGAKNGERISKKSLIRDL